MMATGFDSINMSSSPSDPDKSNQLIRYSLVVLAAGGFVSGASIRLAEPLLPDVAAAFDVSVVDAAVLITAFAFAYGVFQLVHGPLGDRYGKLRVTCGALILAAMASAACATATSLNDLALYRFLTGMTAGAVIPLSFAFVGDNVPFERRQQVLGRFIVGTLSGAAFGPLIGGVCSQYLGWRATFIFTAIAFTVIALLLFPLARREKRPERTSIGVIAGFRSILSSKHARLICGVVAIEGWLFYGAFGYLGAFLRQEFALDYVVIGMVLAGFGIGGLLYSASVSLLVRYLGVSRMVLVGGFLSLLGYIGLTMINHWPVAIGLIMLLGFGFYQIHNTLQTQATEMAPAARGAAIAIFAFALFFGQALGVYVDGLLVEAFGYRSMLAASGVGLVILGMFLSRKLAPG